MLNTNLHDHFYSDYKLYIEGVEVPFESAHISQTYGEAPSASITMPPWPGLQELGRNYAPKVNIFWRDPNFGETPSDVQEGNGPEAKKSSYKLIFSGEIVGTSDSKEISSGGGGQSITLQCQHDINIFKEILIRFANVELTAAVDNIGYLADGSFQTAQWDMSVVMLKALNGIENTSSPSSIYNVPEGTFDRLKGTPGMLRVLWNILCSDAVRKMGTGNDAEILTDMYIPLIEKGLKFWEKITGHPDIEDGIQSSRAPLTPSDGKKGKDANAPTSQMIPGSFRTTIGEAAQVELSKAVLEGMNNSMGSPEVVDFMYLMNSVLDRLEYDMSILASPISRDDGTTAEFVVKPRMPNYYAPICNVILPNMLSSVSVNSNFEELPSRVVNVNNAIALISGTDGTMNQLYTAPHSVRYTRGGGDGGDLAGTMSKFNNRVGFYEWGSGVKSKTCQLPPIYNVLQAGLDRKETNEGVDKSTTPDNAAVVAVWGKYHPDARWPGADKYNPWSTKSGILSFQRLNFLFADHDFAMETAKVRSANASGCFNPYAVVGYPMDLIDPVPSRESYHGMCTSISHTIHASGTAQTSYSLVSVNSFTELALYNMPMVNPYLASALSFIDDTRIYKNDKAYLKACDVYANVFGVGAAEPAILQDYGTGTPIPFTRKKGTGFWTTEETSELYGSQRGSLILVSRNIPSLSDIEEEYGYEFISISDWISSAPADAHEVQSSLRVKIGEDRTKIETVGIDPESSPFLVYGDRDEPEGSEQAKSREA